MKRQGLGGSIVFIGSKNALVASAGASAYCAAKAAEMHLARCLALEGAELGIRVNVVNPDAVIRGSRIWAGELARGARRGQQDRRRTSSRSSTAQRSLLKRSVFPEDIAEAVYFFASELSAKSTGQHPQRRRRQRRSLHALTRSAAHRAQERRDGVPMATSIIAEQNAPARAG